MVSCNRIYYPIIIEEFVRYQDYVDDHADIKSTSHAYVLSGGIGNWLSKFSGQEDLVDHDDQS